MPSVLFLLPWPEDLTLQSEQPGLQAGIFSAPSGLVQQGWVEGRRLGVCLALRPGSSSWLGSCQGREDKHREPGDYTRLCSASVAHPWAASCPSSCCCPGTAGCCWAVLGCGGRSCFSADPWGSCLLAGAPGSWWSGEGSWWGELEGRYRGSLF